MKKDLTPILRSVSLRNNHTLQRRIDEMAQRTLYKDLNSVSCNIVQFFFDLRNLINPFLWSVFVLLLSETDRNMGVWSFFITIVIMSCIVGTIQVSPILCGVLAFGVSRAMSSFRRSYWANNLCMVLPLRLLRKLKTIYSRWFSWDRTTSTSRFARALYRLDHRAVQSSVEYPVIFDVTTV